MRERLFSLLEQPGTSHFWINAPAGFGKTTFAASYAESRKLPCLWYQIDRRDADPATFFHFFGDAARIMSSRRKSRLLHLTPEYRLNIPLFTLRYFEAFFSLLPENCCIVVDNYQDLPADSPLHAVMLSFLEQAPVSLKIVVISREEPLPVFTRLLVNATLTRIGWRQLRLDLGEARQLVRQKATVHLSDDTVQHMLGVTDGWAAGVVLLLEHARLQGSDYTPPSGQARQQIFDYFASQVLSATDLDTERQMLATSFFSRFSGAMAQEISGLNSSEKILSSLCRGNFFITRHQSFYTWYQYHPIFREFLKERAETAMDADAYRVLQQKAAVIADQSGLIDDAAQLYADIENWDSLAALLNSNAERFLSQGRQETIASWLAVIPRPVIESSGYFLYWESACRIACDPFQALSGFEEAARLFRQQGDLPWTLLSLSASMDMCFHTFEFTHLDDLIDQMESLLADCERILLPDVEYRITMSLFNALSVRQPEHPDIALWRERAMSLLRTRTDMDVNQQVRSCVNMITDRAWTGDISAATSLVHLLKEMMLRKELTELQRTIAVNIVAVYAMISDVDAVNGCVEEGLRLAETSGIDFFNAHLVSTAVVAALSRGDLVAAGGYLKQMAGSLTSPVRFDAAISNMVTAWRCLAAGDAALALQHQTEALRLVRAIGWRIIEPVFVLGMAVIRNAAGDVDQALETMHEATSLSERNRSRLNLMMCRLVEAEIRFGQQQETAGLEALALAMRMWREMGNDNVIWWRPTVMAGLCARALVAGIETEFVCRLIRKRGLLPVEPTTIPDCWPWKLRIFTLGTFRIERDGNALNFVGKLQKKPLELLKVLISLGGDNVAHETLCDALWPDAEGDTSATVLATTLFRLRQLLGSDQALQLRDGCLSLDRRHVWVDVWAFERAITEARKAWDETGGNAGRALEMTDRARGLYGGEFLPAERSRSWSFALRERLKQKYVFKMETLCSHWEECGELKRAIRCYHEALEVDNLSEEFYQSLMMCLHQDGQRTEAIRIYEHFRKTLIIKLGIAPSSKTEELYRLIKTA